MIQFEHNFQSLLDGGYSPPPDLDSAWIMVLANEKTKLAFLSHFLQMKRRKIMT